MNHPLISILIPAFNVERFVESAMRSMLKQTYPHFEMIVVDDASTDKTFEILTSLAKEDSRIKLYRNTQNSKIVETLNYALSKASGSYIARMDSDDISLPDRLEKQLTFLQDNRHIDLVGLSYIIIDEEGVEIKREVHLTDFEKIKAATKFVSPIPHFWLAKKSVYDKVGKYRIPGAEDYDFILRAIDVGLKVTNLNDFVYLHRIRNGNTATSSGLSQKKSFHYVRRLQKERIYNPGFIDSFSEDNLRKVLQSSAVEKTCYRISSQFHHKFVVTQAKNKLASAFNLLVALAFSPKYLGREKYNRFQYKKILKGA